MVDQSDPTAAPLSTPEGYALPGQVAALREYYKGQLTDPNAFNRSGKMPFYGWANGMNDMMAQVLAARGLQQTGRNELNTAKQGVMNVPPDPMVSALFTQPPATTYGSTG